MSNLTLEDIRHIIPEALTKAQEDGVNAYLKDGTIPPADPCQSCEPNVIRSLIARIIASDLPEPEPAQEYPTTSVDLEDHPDQDLLEPLDEDDE